MLFRRKVLLSSSAMALRCRRIHGTFMKRKSVCHVCCCSSPSNYQQPSGNNYSLMTSTTVRRLHTVRTKMSSSLPSTTLLKSSYSTSNGTTTDNKQQCDPKKRIITYLTDVEGDASYLDRYVKQSKVLQFRQTKPRFRSGDVDSDINYFPYDKCIEFTTTNSTLVYGGDVWDRGGFDLYVIRQLLDLQSRAGPDRVFFIMGNRDINKLRILQEIGLPGQRRLPLHKGVWWLAGTGRQGDPLLFADYIKNNNIGNHQKYDQITKSPPSSSTMLLVPQTDAAERLKWMLSQTMGSPDAFELRRKELQLEREKTQQGRSGSVNENDSAISDMDVVESYRRSCHPTKGEMGKYLSQAHLTLRLGSVLFLHGALPLTQPFLQRIVSEGHTSLGGQEEGTTYANNNTSILDDDNTIKANHDVIESFWTNFEFAMPWKTTRRRKGEVDDDNREVTEVDGWIDSLNTFAQDNIEDWKQRIHQYEMNNDGNVDSQPWATHGGYNGNNNDDDDNGDNNISSSPTSIRYYGDLMQYGMGWTPDRYPNPTIVYSSWLTNGMPRKFFPRQDHQDQQDDASKENDATKDQQEKEDILFAKLTHKFMQDSDIKLMVCGHQPNGDMPIPIQILGQKNDDSYVGGEISRNNTTPNTSTSSSSSSWILGCDTSYSGDTKWLQSNNDSSSELRTNVGRGCGPNGRGNVAVCEVLIEQDVNDGAVVSVHSHGVLSDGTSYETTNFLSEETNDNHHSNKSDLIVGKLADPDVIRSSCIWDPSYCTSFSCPPSSAIDNDGKAHKKEEKEEQFWVKAKFLDGSFLLSKGEGFDVWNVVVKDEKSANNA